MDTWIVVYMDGWMDKWMDWCRQKWICSVSHFYCHLHEVGNMCRETDVTSFSFSAHSSYIRWGIHIIIIFLKNIIIIYFILWLFFVCLFVYTSEEPVQRDQVRVSADIYLQTNIIMIWYLSYLITKHIEYFIVVMLSLLYCSKLWYY